ncbi:hypothetical protein RSOL_445260 [Rhizoctonia solani AG-3 Rhs1AP]|uniref:Uncharacterized protein n=1 Tax=Rhizoctonia solani AG-3 Rhs1AP TaxID=1086054 RepID=X8JN38_9AGAM|nr:hypothetical protein RSOL_445260 [Rhizoctonia solani AG-3 Rhs1AP]
METKAPMVMTHMSVSPSSAVPPTRAIQPHHTATTPTISPYQPRQPSFTRPMTGIMTDIMTDIHVREAHREAVERVLVEPEHTHREERSKST